MCGIVGIWRPPGKTVDRDVLVRLRERMTHRGPDAFGDWYSRDGRLGLGHRRLSIIDLTEAGRQPMANEAGDVVVCFNGEIYNHADLRAQLEPAGYRYRSHSDTESLLHGYEAWGLEVFPRCHGMWGVAIYDERRPGEPTLHLVRDRMGVKPLYLARTADGTWLFASEIRALLCHPDISPELDRTAFWHYLTFIVAPAPLTMFRGIFKLPAGWRVSIDHRGRARATPWWEHGPAGFDPLPVGDDDLEAGAAGLLEVLRAAIARRMVSDVPFGVLLSGGVDSSMNVALMSELMPRPVTTFSIGYEGQDDYNEFRFARRVAQRYRTDHHEVLIRRQEMMDFLPKLVEIQDEPIADNVFIPLYFLCKLVKDSGTTVVQVGEGADEHLLGYWWCAHYRDKYRDVYLPQRLPPRSWWQRLRGVSLAPPPVPQGLGDEDAWIVARARAGQEMFWGGAVCWWGALRRLLTPSPAPFEQASDCPVEGLLPEALRTLDSHEVVAHYLRPYGQSVPEPRVLNVLPYLERKLRLSEHLLMRVDKCSMAHAVEARVPFLDHEVVEYSSRLPIAHKLRGDVGKAVLKRLAERYLDHDIVYRKKQGFGAPMEEWFREGEFGKRCLAAFEKSALSRLGFFDNRYFTDLLKTQMNSGGGWSFHLWTVMNAVLWHRFWIEGERDCL